MKLQSKIMTGIGAGLTVLSCILGIVYIFTGDTVNLHRLFISAEDKEVFIGHQISNAGKEMPELLAFMSGMISFIGFIPLAIALIIENKGLSRTEKKENSKKFNLTFVGFAVAVLAAIVLMVMTPKEPTIGELPTYHSVIWFWMIIIAQIIGAVMIVINFVKLLVKVSHDSKPPMINAEEKDDFK